MSYPVVDTKAGLAMLGGNKAIYLRLLKTYAAGDLYQKAVTSVESGSNADAQTALHTLKGATGNLHLSALYEKSKELELSIKNDGIMPSAELMNELTDIQAQTLAMIEEIIANPDSI